MRSGIEREKVAFLNQQSASRTEQEIRCVFYSMRVPHTAQHVEINFLDSFSYKQRTSMLFNERCRISCCQAAVDRSILSVFRLLSVLLLPEIDVKTFQAQYRMCHSDEKCMIAEKIEIFVVWNYSFSTF